ARVVGGAVRNAMFGQTPDEIDIATTAVPDTVIERARAAGFKAVPTGVDHGTVTVVAAGRPFEVTTLREDVETFGRHATVKFGRDWTRDAQRRDFTMNGLSLSPDGKLHDDVGGVADLKARRVRFIGDAATRIAEDYLRILRFFRFHAYYGEGDLDAAGLRAAIAQRDGLARLSPERIHMELTKLLLAPRAAAAFSAMADAGLLAPVLQGRSDIEAFTKMSNIEAACGLPPDSARRLAALGVWPAEDLALLGQRLRLSNIERDKIIAMSDHFWLVNPHIGERGARELIYAIGAEQFRDRALLAWSRSDASPHDKAWRDLATLPERWSAPVFPLKAADFIARGVEKGPSLGAALARAQRAWVERGFPMDQRALNEIVNDALGG
ncbi:MAG: CCA tRNA nucleotidyltransferase, partial [Xanthobacteraceae bacterium]